MEITVGIASFLFPAIFVSAALAQAVPAGLELTPNIPYCTGGGRPLLMNIVRPKERAATPRPAVLWIHGGGWEGGSKDDHNHTAFVLSSAGFLTATISYRLSGEAIFPAAVEDSLCAVRFLRANAAQYGIDPDRIGVAGGSAGGHLALMVGTVDKNSGLEGSGGWPDASSRVRAICSYFGPADFSVGHRGFQKGQGPAILKFLGGTESQQPENYRRASPINYISKDDPPLLMIHGDHDTTVPIEQSRRMLEAYRKAGLDARLVTVEGAEHSFKPATDKPNSVSEQEIDRLTVDFFQKHLGK